MMRIKDYNRTKAVAYAHKWALRRNPQYFDFEHIGGDCTNFASQVLYAGSGVMNPTPTFGWYYYSLYNRAPAWTSVKYLYRFLTNNNEIGPVAVDTDIKEIQPGDIVQLSFDGESFGHSPVIVSVGEIPSVSNILVAAHSYDVDNKPLESYTYIHERFLHITHVNVW